MTMVENMGNESQPFGGMFDPFARHCVESNILSLAIPMSRFRKMYYTLEKPCLSDTRDRNEIKERIINDEF